MGQFDIVVPKTEHHPMHEEIFLDCVFEAIDDINRVSTNVPITGMNHLSRGSITNFEFLYELARICYLRYWEEHWNSLREGQDYPYEISEVLETIREENIPEMDQPNLILRLKQNRICSATKKNEIIVAPQMEVW